MKYYDCFMYHDEDLILDIRLNTLNKFIDKFVIVKSKFDHQGNEKKLNFNFDNFKKFKNKIIYLIIEKFPNNMTNWERENYQRNFIIRGLKNSSEDDYIIISDVDEIPNLSRLKNHKKYKYTIFEQKMLYYKINLINSTHPIWYGSKMCKIKNLVSPQWLRNQKVKKISFWEFYKIKWNYIKDGGWHFSYLMDAEKIKNKINSFAHSEFNNNYFKNIEKIENSINLRKDLFDRKFEYKIINFDNSYPKYLHENLKKFKEWII